MELKEAKINHQKSYTTEIFRLAFAIDWNRPAFAEVVDIRGAKGFQSSKHTGDICGTISLSTRRIRVTKGAWMPSYVFLPLFIFISLLPFFLKRRRNKIREKAVASDESSLWVGLAAGLFDSADSPSGARMEIALGAVAHRFKVRAGIVTVGGKDGRRVLACASKDSDLISGLETGALLPSDSIYCGTVGANGQLLSIDYASLSEWRKHPACRDLGWECYLGLSCGSAGQENLVIAFFDTLPREQLFTAKEKALLEQLGPWIAAMVAMEDFPGAPLAGFDYPLKTSSLSGEA